MKYTGYAAQGARSGFAHASLARLARRLPRLSNKQQQANRLVHKPSQAGRLAIKQIRLAGQQAATSRDNSACGFSQLKLDYHKLRPNVSDGQLAQLTN
jgi:hypothetical protein